jgi:outer membrane usher protein FimD/PapC
MRTKRAFPTRRWCCALTAAAAAAWVHAESPNPPVIAPAQPLAIRDSVTWQRPDLELRYELQPPLEGQQGRALVQGEVETGGSRLRAQVRVDPNAQDQPASGMDLSWSLPAPGPLRGLVVGDGYTSGAGWSAPARLTGLRFGRAQSLRAPLRADPAPFAAPAFTPTAVTAPTPFAAPTAFAAGVQPGGTDGLRAQAQRLLPAAGGPSTPTLGDPQPLEAGATDYEVELGRLRAGWDTTDRHYLGSYGSAAYRAGLGLGLTGEARAEWSDTAAAQGFELYKDLGSGATLQALAAQSVAPDVGGGGRWGAGLVVPGDLLRWKLTFAAADREFRSATGGAEARRGLRMESSWRWRGTTLDASFSRNEIWDAVSPESIVALGSSFDLTRQVQLRMDLSRRFIVDPAWRAGVSVSLPLE